MSDNEYTVKLNNVITSVTDELASANVNFGVFKSPHEGVAIIQEEFEEFKASVFWPNKSDSDMASECTQLAAMAIRFLMDICYE